MALTAKEKVCAIVLRVADGEEITPEGSPIKISGSQNIEITAILKKLANDDGVIELLEIPTMIPSLYEPPYYAVQVLDGFHEFHEKLKKTTAYKSMLEKRDKRAQTAAKNETSAKTGNESLPDDVVYSLSFNGQYLLINNAFLLARTDFDSENELVISFLIDNPNKRFTREQIKKELSKREGREVLIKKPFHKIAENLGFKGDFLKAFLDVSKTTICLRNPITRKDLDSVGIKYLKIAK